MSDLNELALAEWYKLTGSNKDDFDGMHKIADAMSLVDAVLSWQDIRGYTPWMFEFESKRRDHYCYYSWYARFFCNDDIEAGTTGKTPAEAITKAFLRLRKVNYG